MEACSKQFGKKTKRKKKKKWKKVQENANIE